MEIEAEEEKLYCMASATITTFRGGNMKLIIDRILNEYIQAKNETFAGHPVGAFFRNDIPSEIYNTGIVNSREYLITGSVGQGNWANVPWVCIFDRSITTSATKGVYIVYLLAKDGQTLYLTFNQGCTEIRNSHNKRDTIKLMREKAAEVVARINDRGFKSDDNINLGDGLTELAELYQKGTIFYTAYKKGAVPPEEVLTKDLENMMAIYSDYVSGTNSNKATEINETHPTGMFDSWEIVDEHTAIKTCDKSFFEHNGSGVPKEICWFFDADDLPKGESKQVILSYDGTDYTGRISNDTTDRRRIRIFWNTDLGSIFKSLRKDMAQRLVFEKAADQYQIYFEGDEQEVSTKQIIEAIKHYIATAGFTYPDGMIENFWLSLKSKPFVILAGTSGTGKTRLVRLFANAISAEYRLVAVRPDWSDSSDLFGYVDLNGSFIPGKVLDFMNQAKANPQKPHILCLDEMNLARVEYYLSDVLSIMETRELKDGTIESDPILTESYYGKKDTGAREQYGIQRIPENFYIVGTVNMDETTFPFSRKVLDRANTIEFSDVDLIVDFDAIPTETEKLNLSNDFMKTNYLFLSQCAENKEYVRKVCDELQKINDILQKGNAHVGYRVRDEIVFYMLNNKKAELIDEKSAFDNEIMQKILPRIQGSSASVKKLLCDLFVELEGSYSDTNGSDSENMKHYMIEKADKLRHPQSANKIFFMTRRFEEDGFTSYWL